MFFSRNFDLENFSEKLLKIFFINCLSLINSTKTKLAFTLAEVLITLLIVGVVSSLVIPALIQETQNAELKVALKKSIAVLSQANTRILTDNGGNFKDLCLGNFLNTMCLKNLYAPYLSVTKVCANSASEGCWHKANNWFYINTKTGCGANAGILDNCPNKNNSTPGYILNDGSFMTFQLLDGSCAHTTFTNFEYCGYMMTDINGLRGPNTVGKDIFAVWIRINRVTPVGYDDVYQGYCGPDAGIGQYFKAGWGCTAQYLRE